jgi:hypothetical protein
MQELQIPKGQIDDLLPCRQDKGRFMGLGVGNHAQIHAGRYRPRSGDKAIEVVLQSAASSNIPSSFQ